MVLAQRADLGHGNVKKLLFSLSVPTITSQIVNMLYNLVDRVFIGHMQPAETVGKLALTGVGRMPADYYDHLGLCFPHGHRRRTARFDCRWCGRE